jgi:hypothetical protein
MLLSYANITEGGRHEVTATVTTDHPASSYGQPVIVLDSDGDALDINSWILLNYRIEEASPEEAELLQRVLIIDPVIVAAYAGSVKGGQSTSAAKQAAARANGKKGGRPAKSKTGQRLASRETTGRPAALDAGEEREMDVVAVRYYKRQDIPASEAAGITPR